MDDKRKKGLIYAGGLTTYALILLHLSDYPKRFIRTGQYFAIIGLTIEGVKYFRKKDV